MKKIGLILLTALCLAATCTVSAETDRTMKISYNGEVKYAKDIGQGKGINIVLPELNTDDFYIDAIELAVFEKKETETDWHIYKDDKGRESKKQFIENPQSLNVSVNFGDIYDYRDKAKYKLAYRYYVRSIDDMSKILVAGKDTKDGWRLVGEQNPIRATDNGFMFYTNADPELEVMSFSYEKHTAEGEVVVNKTIDEISGVRLPLDAFFEGVTVNYGVADFDSEDELVIKYLLVDASTETVLSSGYLDQSSVIKTDATCDTVKLKLTACDNFGGETDTEWFTFNIDRQKPFVSNEFDDLGYMLTGNNLFSDFIVHDDSGTLMTDGSVYVTITIGNEVYDSGYLEYMGDGIYRLDKEVSLDGKYVIELDIYDKAGNEGNHVFYQTLDNTEPTAEFVSDTVNPNATKYSTWVNVSKNVIINSRDDMSGIFDYMISLDDSVDMEESFPMPVTECVVIDIVTNEKTGKLKYSGYISDNAKTIDKRNNRADEYSEGNRFYFEKYVWLDKTPPVIECDVDETVWYDSPAVFNINFTDKCSNANVSDASGIASRWYAVTDSAALPTEWNTYNGYAEVNGGGVFYIHLKAVDNAGNKTTLTKKVRTNAVSTLLGRVEPTDDYMHTIYYRETDFYVIKNTAYNTKFHFLLNDTDTEDGIKTDVRLVSRDNPEVYATSSSVVYPDGNAQRDVVFNMPYIDEADHKLPDGVYDMLISISEIKNDGEVIKTHDNINVCEVIIKRTAPPTPIINVNGGMVDITYPDETTAPSLNNSFVRSKYKRQYKIVKDGVDISGYVNYTDSFPTDNMSVTALYTDIAGNVSVATKRIFDADDEGGSTGIDIAVEGSNTTVEESRAGNVYYIGTRREKQKGINSDIFNFIN